MKVNKNVTLDMENFQVICAVMEKNHINNFSKALNYILEQAVALQYTVKRLQELKNSLEQEVSNHKETITAYRNQLRERDVKSTT